MERQCGYTHETDDERFDDLDGDRWRCPRPAAGGRRCPFHDPEVDDPERLAEALRESIAASEGPVRLIGAGFGDLALDYAILDGPSNHPIDLRDATVAGHLSARHATVNRPLDLRGATVESGVDVEDARFRWRVDLGRATVRDHLSLRLIDAESWFDLRDVTVEGRTFVRIARFERGIYAEEAAFRGPADFMNVAFEDVANFYGATFDRGAVFESATFAGDARFDHCAFDSPTVRLPSASGSALTSDDRLDGVAVTFDGGRAEGDLRLAGASLGGDVALTDARLEGSLRTADCTASADAVTVDCTATERVAGRLGTDDPSITYDLTDAVVGHLRFEGERSFGACRFDRTRFDGFEFGAYARALADREWRLHDPDADASPERLEALYLHAKNGAKEMGETRIAAEFFIHEMRQRRRGYRSRLRRGRDPRALGRAGAGWTGNALLGVACGYGERPFRPVTASAAVVGGFALSFAVLSPPIEYPTPLGYLIFSAEGFVSLILGLPATTGAFVSFLLVAEAFIGGFAIALFVFTLTRSVSR